MTVRAEQDSRIAFGAFILDRADERLWGPAGPVRLGRKAYQLLCTLLLTPGRLVTKEEIFSTVWDGTIVSESVLTTVMKELRRALGDERGHARLIETVYGRGYRFIGAVSPVEATVAEPPSVTRPAATAGAAQPPMVLVSGFDDAAICDRHPWLGTGLREEVLSALARFREIRLVADESLNAESRWRSHDRGYRLTAVLLPDVSGVKVIARVQRLHDDEIVWAESIGLEGGVAEGVRLIVMRIIGAALPAIDTDVYLGLPETSEDFYDLYLRARTQSYHARTFEESCASAEVLERLVRERPAFGLAYPPLIRLYNTDYGYTGLGTTTPELRARALMLARAGLAADPRNAHAHLLLGFCHIWHGEADLAQECLEQAVRLNPFNPARLCEAASGFMWLGDLKRARSLFDESLALQPIPGDTFHEDRAELALLEGDHAEARNSLRRVRGDRLWAGLFAALLDPDPVRMRAWRATVADRWQGADLTDARLEEWIAFHRAFAPELKGHFMALVRARLAASSEMPTSSAKAATKQVIGGMASR